MPRTEEVKAIRTLRAEHRPQTCQTTEACLCKRRLCFMRLVVSEDAQIIAAQDGLQTV